MAAKQLSVKTLALNEHKLDLGEYLALTFNTLATAIELRRRLALN
jgi:hypothetical protein